MLRTLLVVYRLGVMNVARVACYRLQKRVGWFRHRLPVRPFRWCEDASSRVFAPEPTAAPREPPWPIDTYHWFGKHRFALDSPPDWFVNPFNGARLADTQRHWSDIVDFDPEVGDIKTVWELSRFDWLFEAVEGDRPRATLANSDRVSHSAEACESSTSVCEAWLRDWCARNPANAGPHWKCGQEVSLRALNIVLYARDKGIAPEAYSPALIEILLRHLERIPPTLHYAVGQATNHATSEAAALYVLGDALSRALHSTPSGTVVGFSRHRAARCMSLGRRTLEQSVNALFRPDGTFAQYSVTYHRMALDTLSLCECWRRDIDDTPFSDAFYSRARAATRWLRRLVDPGSGDAPNLGPNDGAHVFNLHRAPFREFRPSVGLAACLFERTQVFEPHVHGLASLFADVLPTPMNDDHAGPVTTREAESVIVRAEAFGTLMFRIPRYRYRPNQADAMHVDVWSGSRNLLRDGGSFSYALPERHAYYTSAASHNTVTFDHADPMTRLGRFLFADWLRGTTSIDPTTGDIRAHYRDSRGNVHRREVLRRSDGWCIRDALEGPFEHGRIRWRVAPGAWHLDGSTLTGEHMALEVENDADAELVLGEGSESRHYLAEHPLPELWIDLQRPGVVTTHVHLFA